MTERYRATTMLAALCSPVAGIEEVGGVQIGS